MSHGIRHDYQGRDGEVRDIPDPAHDAEACERARWFHARELYAHTTGRGYPPEAATPDMAVQAEAAELCAALAVLVRYVDRVVDDQLLLDTLDAATAAGAEVDPRQVRDPGIMTARAETQLRIIGQHELVEDVVDRAIADDPRLTADVQAMMQIGIEALGAPLVSAFRRDREGRGTEGADT